MKTLRLNIHWSWAVIAVVCAANAFCPPARGVYLLSLLVDPNTGAVSVINQSFSDNTPLSGYAISSPTSQLLPDPTHTQGVGWDSLASAGISGWHEQAATSVSLSESNNASSTTVGPGGVITLGKPLIPNGTDDLSWSYTSTIGTVHNAPLIYDNVFELKIIELIGSGASIQSKAVLLNKSTSTVTLDGYTVRSTAGSLDGVHFRGLAAQGLPGWQSISPSGTSLSELNLTSALSLAPGQEQPLGSIYIPGTAQDLSFQYDGASGVLTGLILYQLQLAGDVNNDGIVNSQDIALISSNWLHTGTLVGDANLDGIVNSQDIALVSSNWLQAQASTADGLGSQAAMVALPEPRTADIAVAGVICVALLFNFSATLPLDALDIVRVDG